jgi:hypothetical protein
MFEFVVAGKTLVIAVVVVCVYEVATEPVST